MFQFLFIKVDKEDDDDDDDVDKDDGDDDDDAMFYLMSGRTMLCHLLRTSYTGFDEACWT